MKQIPENNKDVIEILYQQLALLAEVSNKYKSEPNLVVMLSREMLEIANTLLE